MTENGSDSLPFEPPEQENIRLREENARLRRLLAVHSIPIPQLPAENPPTKTVESVPRVDKEERARQRIALFRSLFRGREDVFARRWENADGRHGYSNDGYVHQKYPELCRAIGEKIALAKQDEPDKMRRALEDALHEHPAPTLSKLSGRLGYSSSNVLRAHEPDLCEQLSARHRSHVIERRADLERRAAAALSDSPAPSLLDVCKRLGRNPSIRTRRKRETGFGS